MYSLKISLSLSNFYNSFFFPTVILSSCRTAVSRITGGETRKGEKGGAKKGGGGYIRERDEKEEEQAKEGRRQKRVFKYRVGGYLGRWMDKVKDIKGENGNKGMKKEQRVLPQTTNQKIRIVYNVDFFFYTGGY